MYPEQLDRKITGGNNLLLVSSLNDNTSMHTKVSRPSFEDRNPQLFNPSQNIVHTPGMVKDPIPLKRIPPIGHRDVSRVDTTKGSRFVEGVQLVPSKPSKELTFDIEDLDIPWNDLVLKERIGAGILPPFLAII